MESYMTSRTLRKIANNFDKCYTCESNKRKLVDNFWRHEYLIYSDSRLIGVVYYGLEGTSDIHEHSKTRRGIHFVVEHLFNKNASTQSGSNKIFDFVRPALSTGVFVK